MSIIVSDLSKTFAKAPVLDGISLDVKPGELLALLGPSGSGKTTLLRIIAGLERPDAGTLSIDGKEALRLAPRDRRIGFVFQHYALFRHMTIADNIAFGLTVRRRATRPPATVIAKRVAELLGLVQLDGLGGRFPAQLSGGQRQRVALARALAVEPSVLLLDEPFGALDAKVRVELRHWLRQLHKRLGLTTVFVTHDQEEALELADRVAILNNGRIEQVGPPRQVYDHPNSSVVMEFLGTVNRLPCRVIGGQAAIGGMLLTIDAHEVPDGAAIAYVRPHAIDITPPGDARIGTAVIRNLSVIGPRTRIHLHHENHIIEADIDRSLVETMNLAPGTSVGLRFLRVRVFAAA